MVVGCFLFWDSISLLNIWSTLAPNNVTPKYPGVINCLGSAVDTIVSNNNPEQTQTSPLSYTSENNRAWATNFRRNYELLLDLNGFYLEEHPIRVDITMPWYSRWYPHGEFINPPFSKQIPELQYI